MSMNQQRSAHTSATNSPIEAPAGSGLRNPLNGNLGNGSTQAGPGRAGAGSPSKELGSRLFPKRYDRRTCVLWMVILTSIQSPRNPGPRRAITTALGTSHHRQWPLDTTSRNHSRVTRQRQLPRLRCRSSHRWLLRRHPELHAPCSRRHCSIATPASELFEQLYNFTSS